MQKNNLPAGGRSHLATWGALVALIVLVSTMGPAALGQTNVGDDVGNGVPGNPVTEGGDSGQNGSNDSCSGGNCSGDSGSSGMSGRSQKGKSSGGEGQQVTPTPPATSSNTESRTSTARRTRSSSRAGGSLRATSSDSIETILLYPETATPLPEPFPEPEGTSNPESAIEHPARPVREPVNNTSSGGFPIRRTIGILATLVAVGSAWSLLMSGRSRQGRRSMGRAARRL